MRIVAIEKLAASLPNDDATIRDAFIRTVDEDSNPAVQIVAIKKLAAGLPDDDAIYRCFAENGIINKDSAVTNEILNAFWAFHRDSEGAVEVAAVVLEADDILDDLQERAIETLVERPNSTTAMPGLTGNLTHWQHELRQQVQDALRMLLEKGHPDARDQLVAKLDDGNPAERKVVVDLLGGALDTWSPGSTEEVSAATGDLEIASDSDTNKLRVISSGADRSRAHELLDLLLSRLNTLEDSGELDAYQLSLVIEAIGLTEALAVLIDEGASDPGELRAKRAHGLSLKGRLGGFVAAAIMGFASRA